MVNSHVSDVPESDREADLKTDLGPELETDLGSDPEAASDPSAVDEAPMLVFRSSRQWTPSRLLTFAVLPAVATLSAVGAGFLGWQYASSRDALSAANDSVAAARDTTVAILSYRAGTADKDLTSARDRLTGAFLDSYTKLVNDVVIPGAKEKNITAVAQVPAAASVSATATHAFALVFVDQTVTADKDAPTDTHWSVRVTLDKVGGRWLVAGFDPV